MSTSYWGVDHGMDISKKVNKLAATGLGLGALNLGMGAYFLTPKKRAKMDARNKELGLNKWGFKPREKKGLPTSPVNHGGDVSKARKLPSLGKLGPQGTSSVRTQTGGSGMKFPGPKRKRLNSKPPSINRGGGNLSWDMPGTKPPSPFRNN